MMMLSSSVSYTLLLFTLHCGLPLPLPLPNWSYFYDRCAFDLNFSDDGHLYFPFWEMSVYFAPLSSELVW